MRGISPTNNTLKVLIVVCLSVNILTFVSLTLNVQTINFSFEIVEAASTKQVFNGIDIDGAADKREIVMAGSDKMKQNPQWGTNVQMSPAHSQRRVELIHPSFIFLPSQIPTPEIIDSKLLTVATSQSTSIIPPTPVHQVGPSNTLLQSEQKPTEVVKYEAVATPTLPLATDRSIEGASANNGNQINNPPVIVVPPVITIQTAPANESGWGNNSVLVAIVTGVFAVIVAIIGIYGANKSAEQRKTTRKKNTSTMSKDEQ